MGPALRSATTCAWLLLALSASACRARRELRIDTSPQGAQVRLDDALVGVTPVELTFEHYGVRQATFYKDGYRTKSEHIELKKPWWAFFPLDLVTEILLPFGWRDRTSVHVALEPELGEVPEVEIRSVLMRADSLRRAGPDGPAPVVDNRSTPEVTREPEPAPAPAPEAPAPAPDGEVPPEEPPQ